jgi:hypothetical protein
VEVKEHNTNRSPTIVGPRISLRQPPGLVRAQGSRTGLHGPKTVP